MRAYWRRGIEMSLSLLAIFVAVPLIAAVFLFILLPRMRRDEEERKRR